MDQELKNQILARIDARLEELGISDNAASSAAGNKDLIRDWRRKKAMPRIDTLEAMSRALNVRPGWLTFGQLPKSDNEAPVTQDVRNVPILPWVSASKFAENPYVKHPEDAVTVPVIGLADGEYIALRVNGDSMNLVAPEGSVIIIKLNDKKLLPRRYFVIQNEDSATFKRYMQNPARLEPYSSNPIHEAMELPADALVVGRAIKVLHDL